MAIKDLMKATETDRYTADGRDELNKALKADVEDRTYKTGEISEKTGLQKQPDGSWAPPKKGGNPGAKTGEGTLKPSRKPDQKKNPHIKNPDVLGMTANGARKRMEAFGAQFVENKNGKDYFKTTSGDLVEVEYGDNKKVLSSTTYTGGEKPEQVYPTTAGHDIESYINKLHEEGWKNDGWERNSANGALGYFKKGDKTIRVMQNWNGTLGGVSEIKPKAESKPAAESKTVEKFDVEKWKTSPAPNKNAKLDWSHGTVGEGIPVKGKSPEEIRDLITKYDSVGRLSRIGTKNRSWYNNKFGTFEVAGIDNENVYIQEKDKDRGWTTLKTIPLNEIEEINPFHDYGKRDPETGEESPTRPPLPEDAAPRELTGDCKIRVRKA